MKSIAHINLDSVFQDHKLWIKKTLLYSGGFSERLLTGDLRCIFHKSLGIPSLFRLCALSDMFIRLLL